MRSSREARKPPIAPTPRRGRAPTQKNKIGIIARCPCGRQFRITVSVLEAGSIPCAACANRSRPNPALGDDDV